MNGATTAGNALKAGWTFLNKGAKKVKQKADDSGLTSNVSHAASTVKSKADETGLT